LIENLINKLKIIADKTNTHFLDKESKIIQGIEFVGCTLWSLSTKNAYESINDSKMDVFNSHIEYIGEFIDNFRFLEKTLKTHTNHPRVVITHHLPSMRLNHEKFSTHPSNSAFSTNILDLINVHGVSYWFCGHTHEFGKIKYGDMKCIVNPVGYPHEKRVTNVNFDIYEI
jgi:Icc-related predicted phosphoesterase